MSYDAPGSTKLSYAQLEQVWIDAGGTRSLAPLMAAIALAESGGRTGATNPTDNGGTQTSWGLWQVSDGTHNWSYGGDPYNPVDNAKAAVRKYQTQGLGAWGTYTSGAYTQYYQGNVPPQPVGDSGGTGSASFVGGGGVQAGNIPGLPYLPSSNVVEDVWHVFTGIPGAISGTMQGIPDALKAIAKSMNIIADLFTAMLWLMNPSNMLRVLSGFVGTVVLGIALYYVASV